MSGTLYRVLAHSGKGHATIPVAGGRTLTLASNGVADLPYEYIQSNIDGLLNCGRSGTTAQRPANAANGNYYVDTTLSKVIFADGNGNWYDPFTGGAV